MYNDVQLKQKRIFR